MKPDKAKIDMSRVILMAFYDMDRPPKPENRRVIALSRLSGDFERLYAQAVRMIIQRNYKREQNLLRGRGKK